MFNSLCLLLENLQICSLRTGSPKKFADLQFADQSKEICRLVYLRKFTDLRLRIETKNLQIKKTVVLPPLQICHRCQRYQCQLATGINNTGGKFATNVNGGAAKISANFRTIFEKRP
jgi:hypothetical protein